MAATVIEFLAVPGTSVVYMTAAGGSGAPAASYVPSVIAGYLHKITVAEALVGRFVLTAGDTGGSSGLRIVEDLVDEATTFPLVSQEAVAGRGFVTADDSNKAIRERGDVAWVPGAGGTVIVAVNVPAIEAEIGPVSGKGRPRRIELHVPGIRALEIVGAELLHPGDRLRRARDVASLHDGRELRQPPVEL